MSARDAILGRLRRGAEDAPLPPVYDAPPWTAMTPSGTPMTASRAAVTASRAELTARFVDRAVDVGTEVRLLTLADLPRAVVDMVAAADGHEIVVWDDPLLREPEQALREAGINVLLGEAGAGTAATASAFGLTTVDYAIAETGTLVVSSAPGRPRAASLLPARHLAVLPEARIRSDLFDLMRETRLPLPSSLTFITGPSRTADIGLTPVRPAHGPTIVTVFILTDASLQ